MDLRKIFLIFLIITVNGLQHSKGDEEINITLLEAIQPVFAGNVWAAAMRLSPKGENLFFCPMPLNRVLAWLQLGTDKASHFEMTVLTKLQNGLLKEILNVYTNLISDVKYQSKLSIGDGIYYDNLLRKHIKKEYNEELLQGFKLDAMKPLPDEKPDQLSSYLNEQLEKITHKKIQEFFSSSMFGNKGNAMLFSGFHFNGNWDHAFSNTKEGEFQVNPEKKIKIPMMNIKVKSHYIMAKFNQGSEDKKKTIIRVFEIPLEETRFSLFLWEAVGPYSHSIFEEMHWLGWWIIIGMIQDTKDTREINLTLPKFGSHIKKHDINAYLVNNMVKDIFDGTKADFSNMTSGKRVFVKEVSEASYFNINEKGIEFVGAVNGHVMGNDKKKASSVLQYEKPGVKLEEPRMDVKLTTRTDEDSTVNLNRPFVFTLFDTKSRIPIVFGRVSNPGSS